MSEHEWHILHAEHGSFFRTVEDAYFERQGLLETIEEEGESAWLLAELKNAEANWRKTYAGLVAFFGKHGVPPDAFERIREAPHGEGRIARFAHARVLELRLTDAQRTMLTRVVQAVDASHLVLGQVQREDDGEPAEGERRAEELRWEIEHRLWRLVDYTLSAEQKRILRARLPMPFRGWEDVFAHASQIRGLTLGQAGRIRAAKASFEADLAPDESLVERLERELHSESASEAVREDKEIELHQAHVRIARAHRDGLKRLREILGDKFPALLSVPPQIAPEERHEEPEELLDGVAFSEAQVTRLAGVSRRFGALREQHEAALEALEKEIEKIGPDSPQMRAMEMKQAGMAGELSARMLALMGEVFGDVMTADQVVAWVLQSRED